MIRSSIVRRSGIPVFMVLIGALLLTIPAAVTWAEQDHQHGPCADDIAKYCKDVQPGKGNIVKCLKEHEKDLSPACREKGAEMKNRMNDFRKACEGDVQKLCKDVQPGGGRIIKCLKEHEKELSPDCGTAMEKGRGQHRGK